MRTPYTENAVDQSAETNWLSRIQKILASRGARAYERALTPVWRAQAADRQRRFCRRYVAVIGSCGKSTTTMLTARLIGSQSPTKVGLFDNVERNILRTLRKLNAPVDFVVQEVSEFPLGTISGVAQRRRPDCVIVTSIGLDHLTCFRTNSAVADEMSGLTGTTPVVCLNADDASVAGLARTAEGRVVLFGQNVSADVRAENVTSLLPGRLRFDLVIGSKTRKVETRFLGTLMLTNVLGALAAIFALGLDVDSAIEELATTDPARGRLSVHDAPSGHTIVLDTIKAPLWSTRMLVADLENMSAGRRIFVLGNLSDTGSGGSSSRYRQILVEAAKTCDLVIGIGGAESSARRLAKRGTYQNITAARDLAAAAHLLAEQSPAAVVVKGSNLSLQQAAFVEALGMPGLADALKA